MVAIFPNINAPLQVCKYKCHIIRFHYTATNTTSGYGGLKTWHIIIIVAGASVLAGVLSVRDGILTFSHLCMDLYI